MTSDTIIKSARVDFPDFGYTIFFQNGTMYADGVRRLYDRLDWSIHQAKITAYCTLPGAAYFIPLRLENNYE
jgi:hypothetical protein